MKGKFLPIMLLLGLVAGPLSVLAQDSSAVDEKSPAIPSDPFDRGTPLRTAEGFLKAASDGDFDRAAEYLDLRNLRGEATHLTGVQLARRFSVIINRAEWTDIADFVDDPAGRLDDGLPSYRDSIGFIEHNGRDIQLFLQKVPRGDGVSIWKISNATVSLIPELYRTYGYPEPVERLRRMLPDVTFLGYALFKWVIALGLGLAAYLASVVLAWIVRRLQKHPETPVNRRLFRFFVGPVGLWAAILVMNATATALGRSQLAETIHRVSPIPILVTVWLMFAGLNLIREVYTGRLQQRGRPGAVVLMRPATNAIKLVVAIAAVLLWLDNLGIDITTVLAGLGVGGVAVALALQKPMEDVFGAVTLYTQQPMRIGDFCRVGDEVGSVEEIGLRTTRIRTLSNSVIAIPNAKLANEPIDNISARQKIWYHPIIRLRNDTTHAQVQQILEGVRNLLDQDEQVLHEGARVRFRDFGEHALKIEVYAYIDTTDWARFLECAERLNLGILEVVATAGTRLALPAQAIHLENAAT